MSLYLRACIASALIAGGLLFFPVGQTSLYAGEDRTTRITLDYYRALAEGGVADAQLVMGDLYREGKVVPKDLIEAYAWYYLAAQQGVEEAIDPMNVVFQALPQSEWGKAKHLAEKYELHFVPVPVDSEAMHLGVSLEQR